MDPNNRSAYQQSNSHVIVDMQMQGVASLLQSLERLESNGDKFFDSLAMVGQGPPSLLAAQLVSMSQLCQQMAYDAKNTLLVNVPVAMADPVFSEATAALPRSEAGAQAVIRNDSELDAWVHGMAAQTGALFAERQRVAANVQAALSVPSSKKLNLQ